VQNNKSLIAYFILQIQEESAVLYRYGSWGTYSAAVSCARNYHKQQDVALSTNHVSGVYHDESGKFFS